MLIIMNPEGKLTKRTYQILVFTLLAIGIGAWASWIIRDAGIYHWLRQNLLFMGERESQVMGAFLAFVAMVIIWTVPTTLLRYASELPPLTEALEVSQDKSLVETFQDNLGKRRKEQEQMLALEVDDPDRHRFYRRMGGIGITIGLGAFLVSWIIWYLSGEIWQQPFLVGVVSILGGLLSVFTGRPLMFDSKKIERIQAITKRGVIYFLIATMLFLAFMCVWEAAK